MVYSLNSDSTYFHTTTINVDTTGNATVSTTSRIANPNDTVSVMILDPGYGFEFASGPDTLTYEATELPEDVDLYWVDIDLGRPPIEYSGGPTVTFVCVRKKCDPGNYCDISATIVGTYANILCQSDCKRCILRAGGVSVFEDVHGGFYLPAKSVTYN